MKPNEVIMTADRLLNDPEELAAFVQIAHEVAFESHYRYQNCDDDIEGTSSYLGRVMPKLQAFFKGGV